MLAGRDQNIELSPLGETHEFMGEGDEFIRLSRHGRDDDDNIIPSFLRPDCPLGYVFYPFTIGNRGAPVFLDD